MKVCTQLSQIPVLKQGSSICLGVFDGVHLAHQSIIEKSIQKAREFGIPSIAVTFWPHPQEILRPLKSPKLIMDLDSRINIIGEMGIDYIVILRFNRAMSLMTKDAFIERIILKRLSAKHISVGKNFRFGYQAEGNVSYLQKVGSQFGFKVHETRPISRNKKLVSSTRLRDLIQRGEIKSAQSIMGRPHVFSGQVISGNRRGRRLGFPTINLRLHNLILPPHGVYAAYVKLKNKSVVFGVMHLGPRPTFNDQKTRIEIHLINLKAGNLYAQKIHFVIYHRIRSLRKFNNSKALISQVAADVAKAKKILSKSIHKKIFDKVPKKK